MRYRMHSVLAICQPRKAATCRLCFLRSALSFVPASAVVSFLTMHSVIHSNPELEVFGLCILMASHEAQSGPVFVSEAPDMC